jgi:hypothetical protein
MVSEFAEACVKRLIYLLGAFFSVCSTNIKRFALKLAQPRKGVTTSRASVSKASTLWMIFSANS